MERKRDGKYQGEIKNVCRKEGDRKKRNKKLLKWF